MLFTYKLYKMNLATVALALTKFTLIACHTSQQVCYETLDCFSNSYPFYDPNVRPIDSLPESPDDIQTSFLLYSYPNQKIPQELDPKRPQTIKYSTLSKKFKVKIIIHGLVEDYHQMNQWIHILIRRQLSSEPSNVIVVDWTEGAYNYTRAVSNARVVGAQVAQLITSIKKIVSTPLSSIEIIGQNVGAQVAAYAGQRLYGKVGKITGLSPAKLYFDGLPNEVNLDKSDAQIVDIIENDSELDINI